jgi:hypothetical protein
MLFEQRSSCDKLHPFLLVSGFRLAKPDFRGLLLTEKREKHYPGQNILIWRASLYI